MTRFSTILLCLALIASAFAQSGSKPAPAKAQPAEDFSGMYTFLQEGEFVQLTLEDQGKVTGFISRYGDLDSDKGAFLDQFIKKGTLDGKNLAFTSEPIHGTWYEFQGTFARGDGKTLADEGYYVLKGKLTQHLTDNKQQALTRSRDVVFKSFPQDSSPAPAKRD